VGVRRIMSNALYGETSLFPRWLPSPLFFGGEGSGGSGVRGVWPAADHVLSLSLCGELRHDKLQSRIVKRARSKNIHRKSGPKIAALFDELLSTDQH